MIQELAKGAGLELFEYRNSGQRLLLNEQLPCEMAHLIGPDLLSGLVLLLKNTQLLRQVVLPFLLYK